MGTKSQLQIGNLKLDVSNLEKVMYPKAGFTKGEVIDYYVQISPFLLPHLKNRPITLKRYPDGVEGFFFYEKQCPASRPKSMKTADVARKDGSTINYCVMNDLPALVWAANLADPKGRRSMYLSTTEYLDALATAALPPGREAVIV